MTYLPTFRKHLAELFTGLSSHTDRKESSVSAVVAGDSKFAASCQTRDFRVGTYDAVLSNFSAVWPDNLPWPRGIERPAPSQLDKIPVRLRARASAPVSDIHPDWPADEPWPDDIPKPANHAEGA